MGPAVATPSQLRRDVTSVSDDAVRVFTDLTRGLSEARAFEALRDELPGLILLYGEQAAVVAAEWYDEARVVAGAAGAFTASPVDLPEVGMSGLIGWAVDTSTSFPAMLKLVEGGAQKRVTNGARLTVIDNAANDPGAIGTQRYARSAGGCSFCKMLAGRGAVYRSLNTASFAAHENCHCVAVPAFSGAPLPVKPYTPTDRRISDADRARVRGWMASNL